MDLRKLFYRGGCPLCLETAAPRLALCDDCKDALVFLGEGIREHTGPTVYPLLGENALSKAMIGGLKYKRERYWAEVFADLSAEFLFETGRRDFDAICAVPTTAKKLRLRGYNPPQEIARALSRRIDLPVIEPLSFNRRVRDQIGLGARERAENVRGAFSAQAVSNRLLLIDDTYTTGATVSACTEALLQAGAESVTGLVMVRAKIIKGI